MAQRFKPREITTAPETHLSANSKKAAPSIPIVGTVSRPVRQPLAGRITDRKGCTFSIGKAEGGAVIKTEIEFREIAVQMLFIVVLVSAADTALEH
jgi:hypothetical protein